MVLLQITGWISLQFLQIAGTHHMNTYYMLAHRYVNIIMLTHTYTNTYLC